jgi:hypothetical protein
MTFYRPPCNPDVILSFQIFPRFQISSVFLRFPAGIADHRDMTKQPIMIRVVVVCHVTGCYRPLIETLSATLPPALLFASCRQDRIQFEHDNHHKLQVNEPVSCQSAF